MIVGLDLAGQSFELRVFLNNPGADVATETTPEAGYAGSVYVYGQGMPAAMSSPIPITRYVPVTEALWSAAATGSSVEVTLVPVAFGGVLPDIGDLSTFEISLRLHDSP